MLVTLTNLSATTSLFVAVPGCIPDTTLPPSGSKSFHITFPHLFDPRYFSSPPWQQLDQMVNMGQLALAFEDDTADNSVVTRFLRSLRSESWQGTIYITDATTLTPGGTVTDKVYQDPPANTVLESFKSSSVDLRLSIVSSYPLVQAVTTVGTYTATLTASSGDYTGNLDLVVANIGESFDVSALTPEGHPSASQTCSCTVQLPPQLLAAVFAEGYPDVPWLPGTAQTEVKAGDTFYIAFMSDLPCVGARVLNQDACILQTFTFAATTTGSVLATIANRGTTPQQLPAWIQVCDSNGSYGAVRATNQGGGTTDGVHVVTLNNVAPSGTLGTPTYASGFGALKNVETSDVPVTASNYDLVLFSSAVSELSIADPTLFAATKTVTRIAGNYRVTGTNLSMRLRRNANGSETTVSSLVKIAHVPIASFAVTLPAARLRSGGNNGTSIQNHTVTVTLDQQAWAAPSMSPAASAGAWSGAWGGSGTSWTRTLQVHDNDLHQTGHAWVAPTVTNLAGLVTAGLTSGATYTIGGFVARTLTFAAFSQSTTMNVPVVTYTKLTFGVLSLNNHTGLRNATQGNHSDIVDTLTVDSIGTNPTTVWLNDVTLAGQNTLGTLTIADVQETV